jgi:hypothetical protein
MSSLILACFIGTDWNYGMALFNLFYVYFFKDMSERLGIKRIHSSCKHYRDMQLFLLFLREAFFTAFITLKVSEKERYTINETDAPNLIEMKIMFAHLQSYYFLHHAIKKGDSTMIFNWMEIAIPAFKAAKKPHYTQLSIDFMIRFKSWDDQVLSMLDGAMFVHTSTGIYQPLDESVEFVNLHAKSRSHKTDCPNFGANISFSTHMRMNAEELLYGLQEISGNIDKKYETPFTPKQKELMTEMSKIIIIIWPIVCDKDIKVCNILNDDPSHIDTPPSEVLEKVFLKIPAQVRERGKVFETMFMNEKNLENPTIREVILSTEDMAEYEAESKKFRELQDDKLDENDSWEDEEEFVAPTASAIFAKLKSKQSLLISLQRTHSKTKQDAMDVEGIVNATLEEPVDRPAKRVLRPRE